MGPRIGFFLFVLCTILPLACGPSDPNPESSTLFQPHPLPFQNILQPTEAFNIITYLYYYNGGGVAAEDLNGDGLPDLYFTRNQGPNVYYVNEGNFRFRDATEELGLGGAGDWSTGVSVVDINADGRNDIYVCNVSGYEGLTGRNELFVQRADGTFAERAADYGLDFAGFNTQAYWFDYDLDGDLDCYLLRHSVHNDATYGRARSRGQRDSLAGDLLLRNDRGSFTDVTVAAGIYSSKIGYGLSATIADVNGDDYPDIYVCNDFSENDYLYINNQDGSFTESIREWTGHTSNFSMGSDAGDIDGDGLPDLLTLDMRPAREDVLKSTASADPWNVYRIKRNYGYYHQSPHNALQWNRGGYFSEVAYLAGVAATDWSWSVLLEDFNGDGREDIFVANGIVRRPNDLDYLKFISSPLARQASDLGVASEMPSGGVPNQAFRNFGNLAFEPVENDWGLALNGSSTGAAVADLDGDGDPDLVLNNVNAPAVVYENTAPDTLTFGGSGANRFCRQRGFLSHSSYTPAPPVVLRNVQNSLTFPFTYTVSELQDSTPAPAARAFDTDPLTPYIVLPNAEPHAFLDTGIFSPNDFAYLKNDTLRFAGNFGLNSSLGAPTDSTPLRLYAYDVDQNGKVDPLLTYVRDGREVTVASKDELAAQLPAWRRNNLSYAKFSRQTFAENFPTVAEPTKVIEELAHWWQFYEDEQTFIGPTPRATQVTALNDAIITDFGLLLAGNLHRVLPRIGRQDAAALQLLTLDGEVHFIDLGGTNNSRELRKIRSTEDGAYELTFVEGRKLALRLKKR